MIAAVVPVRPAQACEDASNPPRAARRGSVVEDRDTAPAEPRCGWRQVAPIEGNDRASLHRGPRIQGRSTARAARPSQHETCPSAWVANRPRPTSAGRAQGARRPPVVGPARIDAWGAGWHGWIESCNPNRSECNARATIPGLQRCMIEDGDSPLPGMWAPEPVSPASLPREQRATSLGTPEALSRAPPDGMRQARSPSGPARMRDAVRPPPAGCCMVPVAMPRPSGPPPS